ERVVVTGLDRDPDRALEADRVLDVEAVHRVLAAPRPVLAAAVDGDSVVQRAVLLGRTEGGVEVVLCAGAMQAWRPAHDARFARLALRVIQLVVDEDHVVALALPIVELPPQELR